MKLRERLKAAVLNAFGIKIDTDDHEFTGSSAPIRRNLNSWTTDELIRKSYELTESNGLADAIVQKPIQAMADAGFSFEAEDETVQEFIAGWWGDPGRGFQDMFWKLAASFLQDGELCLPVAVNRANGELEIGFIDPFNIKTVQTLPGNALVPDKVVLKPDASGNVQTFSIIRDVQGKLDGDVFFFRMNAPVNSTRGRPLLKTLTDKIQVYDDFLFSGAEGGAVRNAFLFHAHGDNWDEAAQKKFRDTFFPNGQPPNAASIVTSSGQGFSFDAVSPNLQASDFSTFAKVLRNDALGAVGMFGSLYGFGEDINVATMREQMRPVMWLLGSYQRQLMNVVSSLLQYRLEKAVEFARHTEAGTFSASTDLTFTVKPGEVFPKDMVSHATTLNQMTAGINLAMSSDLIGKEKARELYAWALNSVGFEVNVDELEPDEERDELADLVVTPDGIQPEEEKPTNSELMTQSVYTEKTTAKLRAGLNGHK